MLSLLPVLPIVIPLLSGAISLLFWRSLWIQRWIGVGGTGLLLLSTLRLLSEVERTGILSVQIGGWAAPVGITIVADLFSAIMAVLAGIIGFCVAVYSWYGVDERRQSYGYFVFLHVLLMGVCGSFLTGDIFNMYVWFEVMLMASFVLVALGGTPMQMEGAFKYVTLNLVSSALFLAGIGILYGVVGTLNMADLSVKLAQTADPGLVTTLSMFFLIAFGIKAAMFPLFFWLPSSYHTPPPAVSAVFAGLLTKVGVYALIRVFTLIFVQDVVYTHNLILIMSGLTMLCGVLGAAAQFEFRRVLSFHIVSQIGYMTMGLGLNSRLSLTASVFYITHHIIVKTNLFLVSGVIQKMRGTGDLKKLGGLYKTHPSLSVLFLIPAMSLAGLPPLSGFFAKLGLVIAGLRLEQYCIVATALFVSLLTLFSMTKLWAEAFWKPRPDVAEGEDEPRSDDEPMCLTMILPILVLALITLTIGIGAETFFNLADRAAGQLMDPTEYIEAVMRTRS